MIVKIKSTNTEKFDAIECINCKHQFLLRGFGGMLMLYLVEKSDGDVSEIYCPFCGSPTKKVKTK